MVTRFYFPSSGNTPGPTPAASASWGVGGGMTRRRLETEKTDSSIGNQAGASDTVTTNPVNVFGQRQWISDAVEAGVTINGTFSAVFRISESNAAADMSLQIIIRVIDSSDAVVATIYSGHTAALNATAGAVGQELPTTAATRIFNAVALTNTSYVTSAGDRIVVELGVRASNSVTTSYAATVRIGDEVNTADHALTANITTDLVPWLEFSKTLWPSATTARFASVGAEYVEAVVTPAQRFAAVGSEFLHQPVQPDTRFAVIGLEFISLPGAVQPSALWGPPNA